VGPPTVNPNLPQFANTGKPVGGVPAVIASYLLFPWAVSTGDGAYDTGLTVSNTSADPPAIGTTPQSGSVILYFFKKGGGSPGPVTLTSSLAGGDTATYVLSALGSPFAGYVIAVCNFQYAHGFAFINNPLPGAGGAFAEAYVAISMTNPRIGATAPTESTGH
jgi:hypothetical protein